MEIFREIFIKICFRSICYKMSVSFYLLGMVFLIIINNVDVSFDVKGFLF